MSTLHVGKTIPFHRAWLGKIKQKLPLIKVLGADNSGKKIDKQGGTNIGTVLSLDPNLNGATIPLAALGKNPRLDQASQASNTIEIVPVSTQPKKLKVIERKIYTLGGPLDGSRYFYSIDFKQLALAARKMLQHARYEHLSITEISKENIKIKDSRPGTAPREYTLPASAFKDCDGKTFLNNAKQEMLSVEDLYFSPFGYTQTTDVFKPVIGRFQGKIMLRVDRVKTYLIDKPEALAALEKADKNEQNPPEEIPVTPTGYAYRIFPSAGHSALKLSTDQFPIQRKEIPEELMSVILSQEETRGLFENPKGQALLFKEEATEEKILTLSSLTEDGQKALISLLKKARQGEMLEEDKDKLATALTGVGMEENEVFENYNHRSFIKKGAIEALEEKAKAEKDTSRKKIFLQIITALENLAPHLWIPVNEDVDPENINCRLSQIIKTNLTGIVNEQNRVGLPSKIRLKLRDLYFYGLEEYTSAQKRWFWGTNFGLNFFKGLEEEGICSGRTFMQWWTEFFNRETYLEQTNNPFQWKPFEGHEIKGSTVGEDEKSKQENAMRGLKMFVMKEPFDIFGFQGGNLMTAENKFGNVNNQEILRYIYSETLFVARFRIFLQQKLEEATCKNIPFLGSNIPKNLMKVSQGLTIGAGRLWFKYVLARLIELSAVPFYLLTGGLVPFMPVDYHLFLVIWTTKTLTSIANYLLQLASLGFGLIKGPVLGLWKNQTTNYSYLPGALTAANRQFFDRQQYANFILTVAGAAKKIPAKNFIFSSALLALTALGLMKGLPVVLLGQASFGLWANVIFGCLQAAHLFGNIRFMQEANLATEIEGGRVISRKKLEKLIEKNQYLTADFLKTSKIFEGYDPNTKTSLPGKIKKAFTEGQTDSFVKISKDFIEEIAKGITSGENAAQDFTPRERAEQLILLSKHKKLLEDPKIKEGIALFDLLKDRADWKPAYFEATEEYKIFTRVAGKIREGNLTYKSLFDQRDELRNALMEIGAMDKEGTIILDDFSPFLATARPLTDLYSRIEMAICLKAKQELYENRTLQTRDAKNTCRIASNYLKRLLKETRDFFISYAAEHAYYRANFNYEAIT